MDGVLVIDKPAGMGSTDVVRVVRRAAGMKKVGHTGTLDPDATGVLVVCLGRATRLVRFLQAGRKTYEARMVLGVTTTTQDTSGEVVEERSAAYVDESAFCETAARFVGDLAQVPPMVSAVKVGGERLYEAARRGEDVEREARDVTVHELVVDSFEPGDRATASFLVTCSAGTYVRTIAHDIGEQLGCGGALSDLRRVANGPFTVDEAVTLDEVERRGREGGLEEVALDLLEALRALPRVVVDDERAQDAVNGRRLPASGADGPYAVTHGPRLLGIYEDDGEVARAQAVFTRPEELEEGRG